jgi:threonine/homoserine/homoserine lactone efflux protein
MAKAGTIASYHMKIIQIIQSRDETPIDGVFTTAKDAYMTPSNPKIVLLHLSLLPQFL